MKRFSIILVITFLLISLIGCEKHEVFNTPIKIKTTKTSYAFNEDVVIEVTNLSDSIANYYICSSYQGIPPLIQKLKNKSWTAYWTPICDGFISHCCGELQPNESYRDTLKIDFNQGYYRVEYQLIVRPSHEYIPYYSNKFQIK